MPPTRKACLFLVLLCSVGGLLTALYFFKEKPIPQMIQNKSLGQRLPSLDFPDNKKIIHTFDQIDQILLETSEQSNVKIVVMEGFFTNQGSVRDYDHLILLLTDESVLPLHEALKEVRYQQIPSTRQKGMVEIIEAMFQAPTSPSVHRTCGWEAVLIHYFDGKKWHSKNIDEPLNIMNMSDEQQYTHRAVYHFFYTLDFDHDIKFMSNRYSDYYWVLESMSGTPKRLPPASP